MKDWNWCEAVRSGRGPVWLCRGGRGKKLGCEMRRLPPSTYSTIGTRRVGRREGENLLLLEGRTPAWLAITLLRGAGQGKRMENQTFFASRRVGSFCTIRASYVHKCRWHGYEGTG